MERSDGTLVTIVAMPTHASQGPLVNEHSDEIKKVRTEVVQAGLDRAYGTVRHVVQGSLDNRTHNIPWLCTNAIADAWRFSRSSFEDE